MAFKWWLIDSLIFSLVCLGVDSRRRGPGGRRDFINGGPPRRIPQWQADWWGFRWQFDDDGLPPEHPWDDLWDSDDKDDWDSRYPTPSPWGNTDPPKNWESQKCSYTNVAGAYIKCSTGCCISSKGFGCCETVRDDEGVPDHTQLIMYISLGIVGALFIALIVVVIAWKFCKSKTTTTRTRHPIPVKPGNRPVSSVAQVLPANFERLKKNQPISNLPVTNSRTRLSTLNRQPSAPLRSVDQSRQQNRSNQRPPASGTSRYDIFTVGSPIPVLPNYSDVTKTNRPPPEYSVNEPNFGSGYLQSFMTPPPPYSPSGRSPSTPRQSQTRYSRMNYSNI